MESKENSSRKRKAPNAIQKEEDPGSNGNIPNMTTIGFASDFVPNSTTSATPSSSPCPYLDTIQRSLLDFDFEPACSVTLSAGPHIYCCLVCGKYFRGRGANTAAYTHAVEASHYVFCHLASSRFYCLPENYEIRDASLQDIAAALHPVYSAPQVAALDNRTTLARDLFGRPYLPGFIGLSCTHKTDYINAVVQALAHVPPLRDYFLLHQQQSQQISSSQTATIGGISSQDERKKKMKKKKSTTATAAAYTVLQTAENVTSAFGELVRKLWSDQRFKSHVDPAMLVNACMQGNRSFKIGQQAEAADFMAWLLHQLHIGTGGGKRGKKKQNSKDNHQSIIQKVFEGQVRVTTRQAKRQTDNGKKNNISNQQVDDREGSDAEDDELAAAGAISEDAEMVDSERVDDAATTVIYEEKVQDTTFLQLTLDIPEKPLFRDDEGGLVIPQEPVTTVLKKFDGVTLTEAVHRSKNGNSGVVRKRYELLHLPDYLVLHLGRFTMSAYCREKNPTIVTFPIKNFDLSAYVNPNNNGANNSAKPPTEQEIRAMSIKELKALLQRYGQTNLVARSTGMEKQEFLEIVVDFCSKSLPDLLADKYDLVANITHDLPSDVGAEDNHNNQNKTNNSKSKANKKDPLQEGSWKCHCQHRATGKWYEMQDLHVQEIMPQQIGLSESYLLIFERKSVKAKKQQHLLPGPPATVSGPVPVEASSS